MTFEHDDIVSTTGNRPEKESNRWPAIAIAAALGLAGGLAAGYLVFDSQGAYDGSAQGDIDAACAMVERVGQTHTAEDDFGSIDEDPFVYELAAAGQLLIAAEVKDAQYERFGDLGADLTQAAVQLDFERLLSTLDDIQADCG